LFGTSLSQLKSPEEVDQQISQWLCLPVGVAELLQTSNPAGVTITSYALSYLNGYHL